MVEEKSAVGPLDLVHRAFENSALRRFFLAVRKPLGLAAVVAILWRLDPAFFLPGLAVSLVGALGQWWCFACIKTSKELAVNGPYKFVRNPMYLFRFLLVFGAVSMLGNLWILVAVTAAYYFYMVNRVRREERKLAQIFGEPFAEYCRKVNRFLPGSVYPSGAIWFFDRAAFLRNHGPGNMAAVAVFYAACYVRFMRLTQ